MSVHTIRPQLGPPSAWQYPAVALVALTVLALAIRVWGIAAAGVWFDEAYHVALVREPSVGTMLDAVLANPPSDPLFALLLRGWVAIAGHGDVAIRVPSVIAGALTIPATAWLAHEVDGRRAVVVLGALFVALSPYALEFSQEAAPYALATLATTLAIAAAWRWRRTGLVRDGVLAATLGSIAAYAHYVGFAVVTGVWILGSLRQSGPSRVPRRTWLAAWAVISLAWAPWLLGLMLHWAASPAPRATLRSPASLDGFVGALQQFVAGTAALIGGVRPLRLAGVILGGLLLGLGWRAGGPPGRRGLRIVIVTSVLLMVGPALASVVTGAWLFVAHFGLLVLPAMWVVAASGAVGLAQRVPDRRRIAASALAVSLAAAWCLVSIGGVLRFHEAPPHGADGLRELVAVMEASAAPSDVILVSPAILSPSIAQYTDAPLVGIPADFDLRDIYGPFARPATADAVRAVTRAAVDGHSTIWVVSRDDDAGAATLTAELSARYTLTATMSTDFATLARYDAPIEVTP